MDFTQPFDSKKVESLLNNLNATVLVNNVGTNHSIPTYFDEESMETIESIINVNILNTLKLTKLALVNMKKRKNGLILNIGSFGGCFPAPLLQTYAGSKAFLTAWSEALAAEAKQDNIHVEILQAYFVVSNMSKVKKASFLVPSASQFVKESMKRIGYTPVTIPYPAHKLVYAALSLIPYPVRMDKMTSIMKATRKRALDKKK